jgi:short-subunit dehydrogenase
MKFLSSKIAYLVITLLTFNFNIQSTSFRPKNNAEFPIVSKPYAMVAGGSKGIGFAIAEALAAKNYNLILIARHEDALVKAKIMLESRYPIHVEIITKDLSAENSAIEIGAWCELHHIPLKMLCNVAGYGGVDDYPTIPLDTVRYMVQLNVLSCMALTYVLLPILEKNAPSYILNISSMAAFAPIPQKNVYSATKSAILFFSYALHYQLKEKNISVSCLCPGPVFTKPSIEKDTKQKLGQFGVKMAVPVKKVGQIAIRRTLKGKMLIIPGTLPKISATLLRILPRQWTASLYSKLNK